MSTTDAEWRGLTYTALERLITDLHDADPAAIRARFRKLRTRPFPDDIRAGRGTRVAYDLPRVIAILAAFELNSLHLPQGHAAAIVEATWPEWCRACIAAACDLGLIDRPREMPQSSTATVTILPDAFADEPLAVAARTAMPVNGENAYGAEIRVDVERLVAAVTATAGKRKPELATAFDELERSFGWTRRTFPSQSDLAGIARGRGFLEEGPFVPRALALLDAKLDKDGTVVAHQRSRMQALFEYLDDPAPVDAWKAVTGTDLPSPRLGQLMHAWAVGIGLTPRRSLPATILNTAGDKPEACARAYLALIG